MSLCSGYFDHAISTRFIELLEDSKTLLAVRPYLEAHRYQEAVWLLRRAGAVHSAEIVEAEAASLLERSAAQFVKTLEGDTSPELYALSDGVFGVFKTADQGAEHWKSEVASYELSKRLGFDFVPITVKRTIKGKTGSMQYFVKGRHPSESVVAGTDPRIRFFDFIIGNFDRYNLNIINPDEKILGQELEIICDQGKAFQKKKELAALEKFKEHFLEVLDISFESLNPGSKTLKDIASVSDAEIRKTLVPYLDAKQIDQVIERKNYLLHLLVSNEARAAISQVISLQFQSTTARL